MVGARFRGSNRNSWHRWSTNVLVTACDRGRLFEFDVSSAGLKVARWRYEIEAIPTGCRVTETFTNREGRFLRMMGTLVSGIRDRAEHNRATMVATLDNLAIAAER